MSPGTERRSAVSYRQIPVEDLFARHHADARLGADILVELLEIFDPVRRAGQECVQADRHHAGMVGALGVEAIEVIDTAAENLVGPVLL